MPKPAIHHRLCASLSFRQRVWVLLFGVVSFLVLLVGVYFHSILSDTLNSQVSTRAVEQAREIASDPLFVEAMENKDVHSIYNQVARLTKISDADFIVVGDKNGIRLTHPDPEKIGYPMQGGDSAKALKQGIHYYSIRKGSLGFAIRGKSPVFSAQGDIIGVVSVGYLLDTISTQLMRYSIPFFAVLFVIYLSSSLGAWWFSKHVKSQMYGMEPEEIAMSLRVQNSVFEAVYEGIIAVNKQGRILSVNQHALNILGIAYHPSHLRERMVNEYITPADFFVGAKIDDEANTLKSQHKEITCNGEALIATRVGIWEEDQHVGWVISFRPRNDLSILTTQLAHIRQQTDNLRVVSHEYANKLSTISGLIQIGAYDQALNTIRQETETHQQFVDFITESFSSKIIAALLLGKYSRAKELGLTLEFDPYCQLQRPPARLSEDELAAIIGNLLDNAYEATLKNPDSNKSISVFLSDDNGKELVIEVADNGIGIPEEIADTLFEKGITSKGKPNHGIGLHLVHQYVTKAGGNILIDDAEPAGTIFSIFIPNEI
ncbi:ATPase [Vibrio albus]|uniref:histidine kinase n=2 Tax=Vibrio albus TaxID=2200953 RepID=A0A2U3BBN7_9VIBR|nr:ATPase [Vibrio albus]